MSQWRHKRRQDDCGESKGRGPITIPRKEIESVNQIGVKVAGEAR